MTATMVSPVETTSSPAQSKQMLEGVRQWLRDFSKAVRARDFKRGRALFAPDVVGFGTHSAVMVGLEALVGNQWAHIWNSTEGFTFFLDQLHADVDGDLAWAGVPWESWGIAGDGQRFQRLGRATYVLQRRGGNWLAIHSHHSLNPVARASDASKR